MHAVGEAVGGRAIKLGLKKLGLSIHFHILRGKPPGAAGSAGTGGTAGAGAF